MIGVTRASEPKEEAQSSKVSSIEEEEQEGAEDSSTLV
jgi:hypothetical protein